MDSYYIVIDDEESYVVSAERKSDAVIKAINEYWDDEKFKNRIAPVPLHRIDIYSISKILG